MPFGVAAELAAAVSQHAQKLDIVLLEEWQHTIIEQIGRRDGRLAVVELGKAYLGIGVDEGLLVDASNALQIADIERILGTAITWMLALELAVRLLLDSTPVTTSTIVEETQPATDHTNAVQISNGSVLTGNWSMFSYLFLILSGVLAVTSALWLLPRMRVRAKTEVADGGELAASPRTSN